jgi:hypothetical protein
MEFPKNRVWEKIMDDGEINSLVSGIQYNIDRSI